MANEKNPHIPPQPKNDPFKVDVSERTKIRKIIAVVSGKGGVGKSTVTALCALYTRRRGFRTGILDADITGPSIPKMFGVTAADAGVNEFQEMTPAQSATGIKIMSMNLLMENEDTPVIWRSPVITGALKQFYGEVAWGDVDYLFVDMPPGTGDVPLTVFQSLPVAGILVVTTPQELVSMIVKKALGMAEMMNVPVLGIIENMSYIRCPHCDERIPLFGSDTADSMESPVSHEQIPVIAKLPIEPAMTAAFDRGLAEYLDPAIDRELTQLYESLGQILPAL